MSPHITFTAAVTTVVNAGLSLLLAFGVNVTEAQTAAITGFVNAVLLFGSIAYASYKARGQTGG